MSHQSMAPEVVRNSEQWREIWWGNRTYTIRALDSAATLAFTRLLGGKAGIWTARSNRF